MSEKKEKERDEKGDVKFDYKIDWQKIREDRYTYIFHYYDEDKKRYFPYFGLFSTTDEVLVKAKQDSNFYEKQLYWTPDNPPYDFFIRYHNWQLELLVEHFKEVFEERAFLDGYQPSHKYFKIILPKPVHDEIINCINDFELLQIRDLLFEIISVAQDKYIDDVVFWEQPEMQKLITSAEKETQKAIDIIQRLDEKPWMRGDTGAKKPSELLHINFAFNDGTVKIEHSWLAKEFIDHFKRHYSDLHYKNWKLDLEQYPDRFKDNIKKQQFKYRLAKSFYNLLTKGKFFEVTRKEPTPNRLMLCIAKLLEFCSISVAGPDELDEIKIKNVRNWLNRNELQPAITFLEVPANKERLLKYFEPEFINITDDVKRADALSLAAFLSKKYNVDHMLSDLAHITQAIIEGNWLIGHQMFAGGIPREAPFEEFQSFRKLIKGVKSKQKITSLKFKIEGDEAEYELEQRLPIYLIEEALKEYSEDHQVEMDTDLINTNSAQFNQPEERFMVRFVNSFYNYLLTEAPPAENEYMPSERYYGIIADMLQKTWFFYHQRHPDWFIIAKVKQWHKLALKK
ncbi:MAG: hypothetical protein JNK50_06000 [Bacteroidia bacterium]|nr:hypothetical protein [Bacteroidia bacterium]